MHGGPSTGYRWYEDLQDERFAGRMDSQKPGPEVLQDAFFKKERLNGNKEVGALVTCIVHMMITLLSFLQMGRGTLTSIVDMMQIESGVGHEKMSEYCRESEILTIYHIHVHKCQMK